MHEHEEGHTFARFLEFTDPAVAEWSRRVSMTDDILMALAMGRLEAFHQMGQIADQYSEDPRFMTVATAWVAGYLALARRRNSCRFRPLLERARTTSTEEMEHLCVEGERAIAEAEATLEDLRREAMFKVGGHEWDRAGREIAEEHDAAKPQNDSTHVEGEKTDD